MNYLIDTCVISELTKPHPSRRVLTWLRSQDEARLFLSAVTIGEIQKGISKLLDSPKKDRLQAWLDSELMVRFDRKILGIDTRVAREWGRIQAETEKAGTRMPVVDSLIAAISRVHDLTLVTRNIADFSGCGLALFNPWRNG